MRAASRRLNASLVALLLDPSRRALNDAHRAAREAHRSARAGRRAGLRRQARVLERRARLQDTVVAIGRLVDRAVHSRIGRALIAAVQVIQRNSRRADAAAYVKQLRAQALKNARKIAKDALEDGKSPSVAEALGEAAFFGFGNRGLLKTFEGALVKGTRNDVYEFHVGKDSPLSAEQVARNIQRQLRQGGRDIEVKGYKGAYRELPNA